MRSKGEEMDLKNKREIVKTIFWIGILVSFLFRLPVLGLFLTLGFVYLLWTVFFPESANLVLGPPEGAESKQPSGVVCEQPFSIDESKLVRTRFWVLIGIVTYTLLPLVLFFFIWILPNLQDWMNGVNVGQFKGMQGEGTVFAIATLFTLFTGIPALILYILFAMYSHAVRR